MSLEVMMMCVSPMCSCGLLAKLNRTPSSPAKVKMARKQQKLVNDDAWIDDACLFYAALREAS